VFYNKIQKEMTKKKRGIIMIEAIVYESNAGHTKKYAEMLSEKTGLKAYTIKEAKKNVKKKSDIIFMSWVKNGKIQNLNKARKMFNLKAICAVGMSAYSKQAVASLQDKNKINALKEKIFYMQGGFEMDKLKGGNKFIMNALLKSLEKVSEARKLPPDQSEMLRMLKNPSNNVRANNIREIYSYYNREGKNS